MSTIANRSLVIALTGDRASRQEFDAAANAASPATEELRSFTLGYVAITPPAGGATPTALTVLMPTGNTETLTLKGATGDLGIVLHKTDPSVISLNSPTDVVGFDASGAIAGVRLIWT